jgi:hypothetical protein
MDDFTIILPELTDMTSCDLKVYEGLDRLWRIVERYKMTAPITITVVEHVSRHIRTIRGYRILADAWQLEDSLTAAVSASASRVATFLADIRKLMVRCVPITQDITVHCFCLATDFY